ncbi:hypothetical protein [Pseudomonas sp. C9-3]|uniref:hypothetical protein n=1 Tax=Pseudomonas sp. C9-3 TaxID=3078264 RepID=UPI0028E7FBBE|nr:hypothetical protein [Pseudomonas sp. C9-3]
MTDTTPAANWRASGEQDPHAGQYDGERAALALGQLTDDELANAVYMGGNEPLNIERLLAKDPTYHSPIALLTAAKERIRWLSRTLEQALAHPIQPPVLQGGLDVAGDRFETPVQEWGEPLVPEPPVECPHRCGSVYAKESYGAGFIEGSGMCPDCDAAMPAKDIVRTVQVCKLGNCGKAYDAPEARRAYSYTDQPGNLEAVRLGAACISASLASAGDWIDRGLLLLRELEGKGFGVFELENAQASKNNSHPTGEA